MDPSGHGRRCLRATNSDARTHLDAAELELTAAGEDLGTATAALTALQTPAP